MDFVIARQAFVKRDSFWSSWKSCYITYTNELLVINRSNQREELAFRHLRIVSKIRQSGEKFIFVIEYDEGKYKVGFESETVAKQYREKFRTLISNARKKSGKNKDKEMKDEKDDGATVNVDYTNAEK